MVVSAAEEELGAFFLNVQQSKVFRLTLEELGYPQPHAPIHIDNNTAVGIVNIQSITSNLGLWNCTTFGCLKATHILARPKELT